VIVSALATLFVTLQGKMKPIELKDTERETLERSPLKARITNSLFGLGSGFRWAAFLAISLSIAGTSLNGLRQVYDPARALTLNSLALLELRQLHQEVIVGSQCSDEAIQVDDETMVRWTSSLKRIRAAVVPDYVAYAALDIRAGSVTPRRDPNTSGNTNTGPTTSGGTTNNSGLTADVTAAINKTRGRIAPLIGLLNKAGTAQTFSNKSVGDAGHQIALALADIDKQFDLANTAVSRSATLGAEYQAVRTDLKARISTINALVTAMQSSGNLNKADVARQIIGQVQGIEAVAGGAPALKGADALVNDGLVIVNKAGTGD
jgi:hypothetical protein